MKVAAATLVIWVCWFYNPKNEFKIKIYKLGSKLPWTYFSIDSFSIWSALFLLTWNKFYELFTQVILVVGLNFCSQTQVLCLPFTLKLSSVWNYKLTIHTFIHMYTSDVRQQICSKTDVSLISRMMIPGYTNRKCKLLPAWATQEESC